MAAVLINQGTQTTIQTAAVGGTETGVVRLDVGSGTVAAEFGGTISKLPSDGTLTALAAGTITGGTLTNLVSGTINALAAGTITTGTVSMTTGTVVLNTGTITTIAASTQNTLGTVGVVN